MAKIKKNKANNQSLKQAERERINKNNKEYWDSLTAFLKRIDLQQYIHLLPAKVINSIINLRISSFRIDPTDKNRLDKENTQYLKYYLKHIITNQCKITYINGIEISLEEFFTFLLTIRFPINSHIEETNDENVKNAFSDLITFVDENFPRQVSQLQYYINFMGSWASHPLKGYLTFSPLELDIKKGKERTPFDSWCSPVVFKYSCIEPQSRYVTIDGKKREVLEMAYASLEGTLSSCTVHPSLLKKEGDTSIQLFIQKHAIKRMEERLDIIFDEMQYFYVAMSVVQTKKIKRIGENSYLIPIYFYKRKLGYLVTLYVDNILVVTTFLFITQEGTPEGILLNKLTGFKKLDKSYLCIDKLSTFVNSDIASNPELVKLLQDAQLDHLVDLYQEIKHICKKHDGCLHDPSFILEYIQKKKEEEQLSLTEQQEMEQAEEMELTPIPNPMEEQPMLLPLASQQAQITGQQLV